MAARPSGNERANEREAGWQAGGGAREKVVRHIRRARAQRQSPPPVFVGVLAPPTGSVGIHAPACVRARSSKYQLPAAMQYSSPATPLLNAAAPCSNAAPHQITPPETSTTTVVNNNNTASDTKRTLPSGHVLIYRFKTCKCLFFTVSRHCCRQARAGCCCCCCCCCCRCAGLLLGALAAAAGGSASSPDICIAILQYHRVAIAILPSAIHVDTYVLEYVLYTCTRRCTRACTSTCTIAICNVAIVVQMNQGEIDFFVFSIATSPLG